MDERHFGPVWIIPGENHGKYPFCHSVYIDGAGVLIDPGSDRRRLVQLRDKPGVKKIWLSHWHEDHLMHLDLFDNVPLSISEPDAPPLSDIELFLDSYGMADQDDRRYWRSLLKKDFHFRPRQPDNFLEHDSNIDLGPVSVRVIATPGHTPGHLSFLFREPKAFFEFGERVLMKKHIEKLMREGRVAMLEDKYYRL